MSRRWGNSEELPDSSPYASVGFEVLKCEFEVSISTQNSEPRTQSFRRKAALRNSKQGRGGGNLAATQAGNREQTRRWPQGTGEG